MGKLESLHLSSILYPLSSILYSVLDLYYLLLRS